MMITAKLSWTIKSDDGMKFPLHREMQLCIAPYPGCDIETETRMGPAKVTSVLLVDRSQAVLVDLEPVTLPSQEAVMQFVEGLDSYGWE